MFRRRAVKPDRGVTHTDLAMDGLTFRVSMHTPAVEAEGIDEEIVSRLDVLVSENRNDSIEIRHDVLLVCALACPTRPEAGNGTESSTRCPRCRVLRFPADRPRSRTPIHGPTRT